jgi:rubrerythrin
VSLIKHKPSIIRSWINLEKRLSKLYLGYSKRFKEQSKFWKEISEEEAKHARLISELAKQFKDISCYFNENRFSEKAVLEHIKIVDRGLEAGNEDGLSLRDALQTAYDIESSLLESSFYATFANDPEDVIKVVTEISKEEERHKKDIKELLDLKNKG